MKPRNLGFPTRKQAERSAQQLKHPVWYRHVEKNGFGEIGCIIYWGAAAAKLEAQPCKSTMGWMDSK